MTLDPLDDFGLRAGEPGVHLHLRPVGIGGPAVGDGGRPLAGGPLRFRQVEVILRHDVPDGGWVERRFASFERLTAWARARGIADRVGERLEALSAPRPPAGPLAFDRPLVMGIINVTPDSFSDGGDHPDSAAAIAHGRRLLAEGADILDIGGESTRPGADPVPAEAEIARVVPVIEALKAEGAVISIDTRHAAVMRAALAAGASIINDVTALTGDPDSLGVAAAAGVPVILMHMRGEPRTMQIDPRYLDAATEVYDYLDRRIEACVAAGIPRERIIVDPGIGFGKAVDHNLQILRSTALYHGTGCAVLIGVSRKRFIGSLSGTANPKERLPGSLAAGLESVRQGAQILRVHDVAQTVQALAVWRAIELET